MEGTYAFFLGGSIITSLSESDLSSSTASTSEPDSSELDPLLMNYNKKKRKSVSTS